MQEFESISKKLSFLIKEWEQKLIKLPEKTIIGKRNSQHRNIKQIVGHMVDSASNNTHRVVHLQYQESPYDFPNYATFGNNDKWIAIQNYQEENWIDLIQLWKFSNLHYAHIIKNIDHDKLNNEWIAGPENNITLKSMVLDFPRHFELHLEEINELISA
jgi:predicted MPP superfamily phosphohydrolase